MFSLLPLLIIPFVIMIGFKIFGGRKFNNIELIVLQTGMIVLLVCGFFIARYSAMADVETWSGRITSKDHYNRSCSHSYKCNCICTSRDKDGHCESEICQTCYDHTRDYFWTLTVSTGDQLLIETCGDCRNRRVPIWNKAYVGEPAAVPRAYTNYLRADPDSVLIQNTSSLKNYPSVKYPKHHSYYKIDRVINLGTNMNRKAWILSLDEMNAEIGHKKQVNVMVVATNMSDNRFADYLEHEWLYGKKNDLIFVLGAPNGDTIEWARVVTISDAEMLKVKVRDLIGSSLSDTDGTSSDIQKLVVNHFERTPMANFEYLASAAEPPTWALILLYLIGIIGSVVGSLLMINTDIFNTRRGYRRF